MPPQLKRSPARLLAPISLAAFLLAVLIVVSSSIGGGTDAPAPPPTAPDTTAQTDTAADAVPRRRKSYTIKLGDTLGGISEQTGVDLETLEQLNPGLDPQALVAGQKIKLSE